MLQDFKQINVSQKLGAFSCKGSVQLSVGFDKQINGLIDGSGLNASALEKLSGEVCIAALNRDRTLTVQSFILDSANNEKEFFTNLINSNPQKIFIFGPVLQESLHSLLQLLEKDPAFPLDSLFVKVEKHLFIDPRSGEFAFRAVEKPPVEKVPDTMLTASLKPEPFKTPADFSEFIENGYIESFDDEIPDYLVTQDWLSICDMEGISTITVKYEPADARQLSVQAERELFNSYTDVYEQLINRSNVAGHVVKVAGDDYVMLHCPLHDGNPRTVIHAEMKIDGPLGVRSIDPDDESDERLSQKWNRVTNSFFLLKKESFESLFAFEVAYTKDSSGRLTASLVPETTV